MTNPSIFNEILIWPILNALVFIYNLLSALKIPGALGLSIIALTLLIRLILSPLTNAQLKSAKKMQDLKPKMDALAKKYAKDKTKLQQEQLKLYQEAGINPAAGCLPLLLQMPVFIALYNVFLQVLGNTDLQKVVVEINQVVYSSSLHIQKLDLSFFGLNLAHKPAQWQQYGWWLLLIPVVTAGLQWYQTRLMMPAPKVPIEELEKFPKETTKEKEEDISVMMQNQMGFLFPLMIGYFAFNFPVGLALYWNTFTILGIIQQIQINRTKK